MIFIRKYTDIISASACVCVYMVACMCMFSFLHNSYDNHVFII